MKKRTRTIVILAAVVVLLGIIVVANLKSKTVFLNEWFAVDLVKNQDGAVVGVIAICMETGETVYVKSRATVLATGGAGAGQQPLAFVEAQRTGGRAGAAGQLANGDPGL